MYQVYLVVTVTLLLAINSHEINKITDIGLDFGRLLLEQGMINQTHLMGLVDIGELNFQWLRSHQTHFALISTCLSCLLQNLLTACKVQ